MSLTKCAECGKLLASKKSARKHYNNNHSGEIETDPSEFNKFPDTEQRDFAGEEPSTEGHNPEYLTESEREGNNTRLGTLHEFEREQDDSLEEHTDKGEDTE